LLLVALRPFCRWVFYRYGVVQSMQQWTHQTVYHRKLLEHRKLNYIFGEKEK